MECPNCYEEFDFLSSDNAMGYGDVMCPHCKFVIYSEPREDFEARMNKNKSKKDS